MDAMAVHPIGGDTYAIDIRGHWVRVDQPLDVGGDDTAPTPTELFVASLGLCVAFHAGRFLDRHGIDRTGFGVQVTWRMAEGRPARVGQIIITVTPPHAMPPERLQAYLAVAKGCTVHTRLRSRPRSTSRSPRDGDHPVLGPSRRPGSRALAYVPCSPPWSPGWPSPPGADPQQRGTSPDRIDGRRGVHEPGDRRVVCQNRMHPAVSSQAQDARHRRSFGVEGRQIPPPSHTSNM
jgi:uncharacterized OsmC-like protein